MAFPETIHITRSQYTLGAMVALLTRFLADVVITAPLFLAIHHPYPSTAL